MGLFDKQKAARGARKADEAQTKSAAADRRMAAFVCVTASCPLPITNESRKADALHLVDDEFLVGMVSIGGLSFVALTTKRVLYYHGTKDQTSIYLSDIREVGLHRKGLKFSLVVDSAGGQIRAEQGMFPLNKMFSNIQTMQNWVRSGGGAAAPTRVPTTGDIPAQLRQLAELKDAGVVSEEEFAAKKQELLSRM